MSQPSVRAGDQWSSLRSVLKIINTFLVFLCHSNTCLNPITIVASIPSALLPPRNEGRSSIFFWVGACSAQAEAFDWHAGAYLQCIILGSRKGSKMCTQGCKSYSLAQIRIKHQYLHGCKLHPNALSMQWPRLNQREDVSRVGAAQPSSLSKCLNEKSSNMEDSFESSPSSLHAGSQVCSLHTSGE